MIFQDQNCFDFCYTIFLGFHPVMDFLNCIQLKFMQPFFAHINSTNIGINMHKMTLIAC